VPVEGKHPVGGKYPAGGKCPAGGNCLERSKGVAHLLCCMGELPTLVVLHTELHCSRVVVPQAALSVPCVHLARFSHLGGHSLNIICEPKVDLMPTKK